MELVLQSALLSLQLLCERESLEAAFAFALMREVENIKICGNYEPLWRKMPSRMTKMPPENSNLNLASLLLLREELFFHLPALFSLHRRV